MPPEDACSADGAGAASAVACTASAVELSGAADFLSSAWASGSDPLVFTGSGGDPATAASGEDPLVGAVSGADPLVGTDFTGSVDVGSGVVAACMPEKQEQPCPITRPCTL